MDNKVKFKFIIITIYIFKVAQSVLLQYNYVLENKILKIKKILILKILKKYSFSDILLKKNSHIYLDI